ncbi:SHOCT domain-containing protein [Paracoccus sp. (in: a-proteobacteria)]|uniref:SHOCT domain-containing protein n=1 Tax=Paracoccus sp. TaxID=267 RepID=UPI0035B37608
MHLTDEHRRRAAAIAHRHGFSPAAAEAMLLSLARGRGTQAQFDHPEFGGMGQWSGGMLMIGAMFDNGLKARVEALIGDLSHLAGQVAQARPETDDAAASEWPASLGVPSATGSQGGTSYAVFPATRRLAVRRGGRTVLYDTGDHRIGGVSQQQGTDGSLAFTSQHGPVSLDSLSPADLPLEASKGSTGPDLGPAKAEPPSRAEASITATIEQLHALLSRGVLTQAEFDAKKAELLGRL